MAKQSQLDKMLAGIDAEITALQNIKARIQALVKQAPVRRPRAVSKDEKASA